MIATAAGHVARPEIALSWKSGLVLGIGIALVLSWLWTRLKIRRRRLAKAFNRSLAFGTQRKQLKSMSKRKVMTKARRARKSTWRFRTAVLFSALLMTAWLWTWVEVHK